MELMKPNFNFEIAGDVFLSPIDLQALTLLYQPIMGVDAFSLYMTLLSLPKMTAQKHHLLLQITGENMGRLMDRRYKLEAMGLLDSYQSESSITYFLKQPLSIKQFFGDAIMRAFLYVKLGAQDFNTLRLMLIKEETVLAGEKVTKRFDEVFDVRPLSRIEQHSQVAWASEKLVQGIEVAPIFDEVTLRAVLVKKGISPEIITPDLIRILNEFAFLYKFDVHELSRLVFDALIPDGTVDILKMKNLARMQFQLMSKGENVQVVVKEEQIGNDSVSSQEKEDIISFMEQSPVEFLRFKSAGKPPVPADIRLVEWLYTDQGMPAGVVNVLVDYVLDYTNGSLPKQLIEKIAGQWQRQGINTTQKAMNQVIRTVTKSINYQKEKERPLATNQNQQLKSATRVEPIPEWLSQTEFEQQREKDDAARERIEQMKQLMRNESQTMEASANEAVK